MSELTDFTYWTWGVRYPDGHIEVCAWRERAEQQAHNYGGDIVGMPPDGVDWLVIASLDDEDGPIGMGQLIERPSHWERAWDATEDEHAEAE